MTEEDALWAAVGANPADGLPRLVLADWLDENAGEVVCDGCKGRGRYSYRGAEFGYEVVDPCDYCRGTGRVPDGRADTAAALRATADRVPIDHNPRLFGWNERPTYHHFPMVWHLNPELFRHLSAANRKYARAFYPTDEAAIRDLCRAWVAVRAKGGQ